MHSGDEIPMVAANASLKEAIVTMSSKRFGITGVADAGKLAGCLTDGDLRRILESGHADLDRSVCEFMHERPRTILPDHLASEAVRLMEEYKITALFVVDAKGSPAGIIHMHDLLKAGLA
jgi:arabinose-5-phosphate isomerase